MAQKIDSGKFFPSTKNSADTSSAVSDKENSEKDKSSSALVVYKKQNISSAIKPREIPEVKPFQFKTGSAIVKKGENSEEKEAEEINNKLKLIEKFFKSELLASEKKSEVKREDKEKKDFETAENKLETPKIRQFRLPSIPIPKLGFMERVKRFLFFTAVGWLFSRLMEFMPKLEEFVKKLEGISKFFVTIFEKLHDGFKTLVKFGSDLKDKTLGFISDIPGGREIIGKFSELEKQFSMFTDVAIIATILAGDIGLTVADELDKLRKERKASGESPKGGKPPVARGGEPEAAKPKPKPGTKPKGGPRGKITPRAGAEVAKVAEAPSFWDKILKGPFAKLKGPLKKFGAAVIPGLGAVAGAADAYARFKSGDKVGGTLASISAGLDGISVVLALTGIGAPVAAALGTISMSIDALLLIRDVIKEFFPYVPMFSGGGRVIGKYQSGGTTRGREEINKPITRTVRIAKTKPPKIKPEKSKPGKDIGGEGKIKRLYPDPKDTGIISVDEWLAAGQPGITYENYANQQRSQGAGEPRANPYKVLTTAATKFKELPMGLGNIVGAAIDSSLGQKVDIQGAVKQFSSGLNYLFDVYTNGEKNTSQVSLSNEITKYESGGFVPFPGQSESIKNSANFGDMISKVLEPMVSSKINDILDTVKTEIQKKAIGGANTGVDDTDADMQPGEFTVSSSSGDFWLLSTIALFENASPDDGYQGAVDVAQVIYNRLGLPGWPKDSIRSVILQGSGSNFQFSPVGESRYGGVDAWRAINSKDSAIAFATRNGRSQSLLEDVAAAILDPGKQQKARDFIGPRDSFATYVSERTNDNFPPDTQVDRYGHSFGFQKHGRNIAAWRRRSLQTAPVPTQVVTGQVQQTPALPDPGGSGGGGNPTGQNGRLPASELMDVGDGQKLWKPAAVQYLRMKEDAKKDGVYFRLTEGYRTLATQQRYWANPPSGPGTAAYPGTSKHGWGRAIDISSPGAQGWIKTNGVRYGWIWPQWARSNPYEPWHFEYVGRGGAISPQQQTPPGQSPGQQPSSQGPSPRGPVIQAVPGTRYTLRGSTMFKGTDGKYYSEEDNGQLLEVYKSSWEFIKSNGSPATSTYVPRQSTSSPPRPSPGQTQGQTQGQQSPQRTGNYENSTLAKQMEIDRKLMRKGWISFDHRGEQYRFRVVERNFPGTNQKIFVKEVEKIGFLGFNTPITIDGADDAVRKSVFRKIDSMYRGMYRGGMIGPSKPRLPIPNSYASYESSYGGEGSMIAIQPIIIRQTIPVSSGTSGNDIIMFPIPISVNSNTDTEYNRSRGY